MVTTICLSLLGPAPDEKQLAGLVYSRGANGTAGRTRLALEGGAILAAALALNVVFW